MDCIVCKQKKCKTANSCGAEKYDYEELISEYSKPTNQKIVQSAAELVDNGKAGTLSRLQEISEFISSMKYNKIGLAYCYGMEKEAKLIKEYFDDKDIKLSNVTCSIGGVSQSKINESCSIYNVSCNPIGQALQLNSEGVDLTLIMGICLGHDILLQRNLKSDFTTITVKDRVFKNNPLQAVLN